MKRKYLLILFVILFTFFSNVSTSMAHLDDEPNLYSEAAILIDAKSSQILYEKNAKQQMYPASITKIVTGIMAIEEGNLRDLVSVSKEATEVIGTRVYLVEDEEIELKRLVQGLLINSGNDAGIAIAEYFAGSEARFAARMNEFVRTKIGVMDSNFTNPHGLFDENHYSTAYDMAKIAQYAMRNEVFKEIVGTKELEWDGEEWDTTLYNHHRLLWDYEGVTGIKNGYVAQSGFTLVTSAERNGMELIVVTLKAPSSQNAYDDTTALLDYGFENFSTEKLSTHDTYTDDVGNQYKLDSEEFITLPKGEEVSKDLRGDSLFIKREDGTILFEQQLSRAADKTGNNKVQTETQSVSWFQKILNLFNIFG